MKQLPRYCKLQELTKVCSMKHLHSMVSPHETELGIIQGIRESVSMPFCVFGGNGTERYKGCCERVCATCSPSRIQIKDLGSVNFNYRSLIAITGIGQGPAVQETLEKWGFKPVFEYEAYQSRTGVVWCLSIKEWFEKHDYKLPEFPDKEEKKDVAKDQSVRRV